MKRFVVVYGGQVHPVRSKSVEGVKNTILKAYAAQDASEQVKVGRMTMSSTDIAQGNYRIVALDEWFIEGTKRKEVVADLPSPV